jgi:molybdopterin-guanine dinucleotide biosynthesis protein A
MQASGFVLAGGASKRMGRAKALLPYRGTTLVEYVADAVRGAAGSVVLIGDPASLVHLGLPVLRDEISGCGPAGGIYTALRATGTDWNLVVACDMPAVSGGALSELINAAEKSESGCVAAASPDGRPEPLCAVYHRRCLPALDRAIKDKRLKMRDLVREMGVSMVAVAPAVLANVNTPDEWSEFESAVPEEAS